MKKFKTESQKLLDLMINSIYTNQEIFLRELISNASDAVDKLHFKSLTDKNMDFSKESFEIFVSFDDKARTITVSDNGIGMNKEELDKNLGTIAHSDSYDFKSSNSDKQGDEIDIIGQFGVGFYSCFMVGKKVEVISKAYGSDSAYKWESDGIAGYNITDSKRESRGTDVIVYLKDNKDGNNYDKFCTEYELTELIKKYSNYVRYPIKMEVTKTEEKEKPADAGDDYTPEYEEHKVVETINSMIPIWKRKKSEVKEEEYEDFYKSNFHDYSGSNGHFDIHAEGALTYDALIYIPKHAPYDMYSKDYKKGLALYNSNVMIMEKCEELVPDYFNFIKGVVDSPDLTLNISRETLQHNTQLNAISKRIEKKVKAQLAKMRDTKREDYESFYDQFGRVLKFGIHSTYGAKADLLADLLLFYSATQKKLITLNEYLGIKSGNESKDKDKDKDKKSKDDKTENPKTEVVGEEKKCIYYAAGSDFEQISKMPVVTTLLDKGYDVLLLKEDIDEFCITSMHTFADAEFKNVSSGDLGLDSEEEKKQKEKIADKNKDMFEAMKKAIGDDVSKVTVSNRVTDAPACLSAEGPVSFEMERVMADAPGSNNISATRVLELNPKHKIFDTLVKAYKDKDNKKVDLYAKLLFSQALLVEGLPLKDPVEYAQNISKLMV